MTIKHNFELAMDPIYCHKPADLGCWQSQAQALFAPHNDVPDLPTVVAQALFWSQMKLESATGQVDTMDKVIAENQALDVPRSTHNLAKCTNCAQYPAILGSRG